VPERRRRDFLSRFQTMKPLYLGDIFVEPVPKDWRKFCRSLPNHCSQCGRGWRARACGPTHAAIRAARKEPHPHG